jgi:hypothetical protein
VREFISYSSVDGRDFAFRLADALLVGPTPITTWLDKRSLMPNRDWDVQIILEFGTVSRGTSIPATSALHGSSVTRSKRRGICFRRIREHPVKFRAYR